MRDQILKQAKRVVVKVGSSLIARRGEGLLQDRIERLAEEIVGLLKDGREVLLVTSGAIVSGISVLGLKQYPGSLPVKQAAAAVGQSRLMWAYEKAFERLGRRVAQILLTHQDLADRRRFLNARHTMNTLLEFGIVPIINENDTVAVDEIRVGDNDTLAAEVALLVDADVAVILSDVEGLYTADPRQHPHASLISLVESITEDIEGRAGGSVSFEGTGGMATKIRAAKMATSYGIATLILNGATPGLLSEVFQGKAGGTFFTPRPRKLNSRKHWIAFTLRAKGQLVLDAGAIEALTTRGKSLLASGIREVMGDFSPGDALTCLDEHGKEIAKGLVNFSSDSLKLIKGRKTTEIQAILGEQEYEEVIHRDNLAILEP